MSHKEDGYRNVMVRTETFEHLDALIAKFKVDHPIMKRVSKPMIIEALVREAAENGVTIGKDQIGPVR